MVHLFSCLNSYIGLARSDSWIAANSDLLPKNYENSDIYIASLYWTMTTFTTVGYGDFTATTSFEYFFQCIVMLIGIGFFGYIIGNVSNVFVQVETSSQIKYFYEEEFNLWLIRLNKANKNKMLKNDYFTFGGYAVTSRWDKDFFNLKYNEYFSTLKPRLQNVLSDALFTNMYQQFSKFFKNTEIGFKRAIVSHLRFEVHCNFPPYTEDFKKTRLEIPPDQSTCILAQDEIPDKIIFVSSGEVYASNSTGR